MDYRRIVLLVCLVIMISSLGGCAGPARILGGNARMMFTPMRRLTSRISEPVRKDARLAILWVGHATVLVQMDDRCILTDPIMTDEAGRISQRLVEPGLAPQHVPILDAVLISHMHFDHLSVGTLEMLAPKIRRLFVPEQGLTYVPNYGFPAQELQRWERQETDGLSITAVPVVHSGWRYGADVGWATKSFTGYVIQYHGLTVYFGGDTAYTKEDFVETQKRFPMIDLAILPIGPIHPRSIMKKRHMDPVEAVEAFLDLRAKWMMPMHFETFINSADEPGEPESVLRRAMHEHGLSEKEVNILDIGEQRVLLAAQGGI
ncbi:MAG TPA: MBL fold metallo-hydrolase [Polyangium sp.]|nr:MBL fold metallo-hydrolase [Polyangium sp.]